MERNVSKMEWGKKKKKSNGSSFWVHDHVLLPKEMGNSMVLKMRIFELFPSIITRRYF